MSDKPIQVGDLVMIVRWPCCGVALGRVFIVGGFIMADCDFVCNYCRTIMPRVPHPVSDGPKLTRLSAPITWVKRLDPDALKDDVPTKEELTA